MKQFEQILVLDGTGVHNVGRLQMHVCNWGAFGSYPSSTYPTAEFPSAQWPANSGVEYLYIAGLWVGAKKGGIPVVTTAAFQREFLPDTQDERFRIYTAYEGILNGARYPGPADDDSDGRVDEDFLDGFDNDGDGQIDEDYAAKSNQMFTCIFSDMDPILTRIYPEHTPLDLGVLQESYQWEDVLFYDFIGIEYNMVNMGSALIEDLYIGFFADGDAGARDREQYWQDDLTAYWSGVRCGRAGELYIPVRMRVAYFYDDDGDEGDAEGYLGVMFLGHDTDPLGDNAPRGIGITSYQNFSGDQPYENGGDPENDYQRYELMSQENFDRPASVARDYRMMMAVGPFRELWPDSVLVLQVAFVCGQGLEGMLRAATSAAMAYNGSWFDVDGNPQTGINGRESPVPGPAQAVVIDSCDDPTNIDSAIKGEVVWVNADCLEEIALWESDCPKGDASRDDFKTGIDGKETQVHWLVGSAPPPPNMRLIPGNSKVTILWDNFSESSPDVSTLELDFEGYRVWRADGWERPFGTSVLSGPSRESWQLLEERDLVMNIDGTINVVPPNIDFKRPFSTGGWLYEPLQNLESKDELMKMFEETVYYAPMVDVPCPPGLTELECDTLEALARYNLGFEGGAQYYKYVDTNIKNGMHYFYAVTAYDHEISDGVPVRAGKYGDPSSNFQYISPLSHAQSSDDFDEEGVYVVPNPATVESMEPWSLEPNWDDPTGIKVEFRNLPDCDCTVRIFTIAGDLVEVLYHRATEMEGTLPWDLVSRNGQDVTSGVYLFAVEPDDDRFPDTIGKFVVIR